MGNIAALEWARLGQNYVRSMILLDTAGQQSSLRSVTPPDQQYFGASSSMALPSCFDEIDDRFRHGFDGERTTAISKQSSPRAIEFLHDRPDKPLGFDTDCYVHILDKIKSYNVALGRLSKSLDREEGLNEVLAQVKQPSLVIGIRAGDHLATAEKVLPYKQTPHVEFVLIEKEEGTNASLLEAEQLDALFHSFFQSVSAGTLGKDLDTQ
jgi:homoserine acetyltransferase